jgi:hypothetical protein
MSGFEYVMSNPSFAGSTLKIGMSERDVSLAVETIRENATIKYEELFAELDPLQIKAKTGS